MVSRDNLKPYLLISLAWTLSRLYPLANAVPLSFWEVWEAKKLMEYGFLERHGAVINWHFMTGHLENPEMFNYINHPLPMIWLDTGIFHLFGGWGIIIFNAVAGLLASFVVYVTLKKLFSPQLSLFGSLIYVLAPASILFDVDPSIVALGSLLWPFATYIIISSQNKENRFILFAAAVLIFIFGQISWFSFTLLPSILIIITWQCNRENDNSSIRLRRRLIIACGIGAFTSVAFFLCQILYYTPDWHNTVTYITGQHGLENNVSFSKMVWTIIVRSVISAGPALSIGALLCFVLHRRINWHNCILKSSIIYLMVFAVAAMVLPRFFFRERTMYAYLIFPLTILSVQTLDIISKASGRRIIMTLAVFGALYPQLQASIPPVSDSSIALGRFINTISQPTDVVATNWRDQNRPFENWDIGGIHNLGKAADRLLRGNIITVKDLENVHSSFKNKELKIVYLFDVNEKIDNSLKSIMEKIKPVLSMEINIARQKPKIATKIRNFYWKLTSQQQATDIQDAEPWRLNLLVYRFTMSTSGRVSTLSLPSNNL